MLYTIKCLFIKQHNLSVAFKTSIPEAEQDTLAAAKASSDFRRLKFFFFFSSSETAIFTQQRRVVFEEKEEEERLWESFVVVEHESPTPTLIPARMQVLIFT